MTAMHRTPSRTWLSILLALSLPWLCKNLLAEPSWQKVVEDGWITIFTRNKTGTSIKEVKAIAVIDSSPQSCMNVVNDLGNFKDFMPYTEESSIHPGENDRVVYSYQYLKLPFISDRDYYLRVEDMTPATGTGEQPPYYMSQWTLANEHGPKPREGVVRVEINRGYWRFEPLASDRTRVTYYEYTDPGGMIPSFIANIVNTEVIPDLFKTLRDQSKKISYQKPGLRPHTPLQQSIDPST